MDDAGISGVGGGAGTGLAAGAAGAADVAGVADVAGAAGAAGTADFTTVAALGSFRRGAFAGFAGTRIGNGSVGSVR
jgi:hypothetical protein